MPQHLKLRDPSACNAYLQLQFAFTLPFASFLAPLTSPPNPPHPLWQSLYSTHGKVPAPRPVVAQRSSARTLRWNVVDPANRPRAAPAVAHQPVGTPPAVLRHFRAIQLSIAHHAPAHARGITPGTRLAYASSWQAPRSGNPAAPAPKAPKPPPQSPPPSPPGLRPPRAHQRAHRRPRPRRTPFNELTDAPHRRPSPQAPKVPVLKVQCLSVPAPPRPAHRPRPPDRPNALDAAAAPVAADTVPFRTSPPNS